MTRRSAFIVCTVFAAASIVLGGWSIFGPGEIRLTEKKIQSLIDQQLPKTKNNITVDKGTVRFKDGQAEVGLMMRGSKFKQQFSLSVSATGQPYYNPLKGTFYFKPKTVEIIDFTLSGKASVKDKLVGAAKRYFPNSEGAANIAEDIAPVVQKWLQDAAEHGAEFALERIPVYTLPDNAKGMAAMAVLGDVSVKDKELVIQFTLWRLTWWVIIALLAASGSIVVLIGLIRNPEFFLAIAIFGSIGGDS